MKVVSGLKTKKTSTYKHVYQQVDHKNIPPVSHFQDKSVERDGDGVKGCVKVSRVICVFFLRRMGIHFSSSYNPRKNLRGTKYGVNTHGLFSCFRVNSYGNL